MEESKGFNRLVDKFSNILSTSYFSSNLELAFHSDKICAKLTKQIAVGFATYCDSLFKSYTKEEKEKWFNEFLEEYKF